MLPPTMSVVLALQLHTCTVGRGVIVFCRVSSSLTMALKGATKKRLISKHRTHDKDTGSPQVQVAILTKEIGELTKHLQEHKKDQSARRGLLGKVARRRQLLSYLKMNDADAYQQVVDANKLKK